MREEIGYLALGEVELYVEDVGEGEPTFFVLHGGPGGNAYVLREGLEPYLEGFRVVYFDQRGSGRSLELPKDPRLFTLEALVGDLFALAEALGVERFGLIAHGFGALIALEALRLDSRALGAILIGPWVSFPWLAQRLAEAAGVGPEEDPEATLQRALSVAEPKALFDRLMFPSLHGRLQYEWLAEGSGILGADSAPWGFVRNGLWRLDYTPLLAPYGPVAILVGEFDRTSYPYAEEVASRLQAPLRVIPGAGHYPWIDEPEAFGLYLTEALEPFTRVGVE